MGGCWVAHWARTGEFVLKANDDKSSDAPPETTEDKFDPAHYHGTGEGEADSDPSSLPSELIGDDDDPLIPTAAAIDRVFYDARATWQHFVREAKALPACSFPRHLNDPYILLQDVPALPSRMPSALLLAGRPIWYVPDPGADLGATSGGHEPEGNSGSLDLQTVAGLRENLTLWRKDVITCRTTAVPPLDDVPALRSRGHLILTLGWAYILSVRLLEIQHRKVVYTQEVLQPQNATDAVRLRRQGRLVLNLTGDVSPQLVRWLCALLSPQLGWRAQGARMVPPWALHCTGDVVFAVIANDSTLKTEETAPPTSTDASILLAEFCALYNLDAADEPGDAVSISPITASFMAALALPLHRLYDLQPQFPIPRLRRLNFPGDKEKVLKCITRYVDDLRYFMTLSMSPWTVGSVIWSVFWQPDTDANLVSPWLAGALEALRPILASGNVVELVQVFAQRRPRVALWWLGLSLLGNQRIVELVTRYLETSEEEYGHGSLARASITAFAWTGVQHAFSHAPPPRPYKDEKDTSQLVARADLLWHRLNFNLQDDSGQLAWRPFGHVRKEYIERDIWPWLEHGCQRRYVKWIWWFEANNKTTGVIKTTANEERGFQADTGRAVQNVPDVLDVLDGAAEPGNAVVKLQPSMEATLRMVHFCMMEMGGELDMSLAVLNGITSHKWLRGWGMFR
ncbi:hypothetical protein SPBR_04778 [Sporothrix brasiliensis 5110]|uniref:Uncharacterized protein n=1 Tax=Sporothrix brasiliensis 5110 TaxID=1398154 RepID=A0A0C2IDD5_9PEZI|nr:uncharacterized protein SPBR_04778 [Sporothrix brasiliensis 5110]KIH87286.1 hypothetical protein SPBR_04778 [Sporothrix brasiliensis 5110]